MTYQRPPGAAQADFQNAKAFEEEVRLVLGQHVIDHSNSSTELDFYVAGGFFVECKEKKQRLTDRWHRLEGVPEENLFVLDELSLRKALGKGYLSYFVLRDVPQNRIFLAAGYEIACGNTARVQRVGKGKLLLDLSEYRQLHFLHEINERIFQDQIDCRWKRSECISEKPVPQV